MKRNPTATHDTSWWCDKCDVALELGVVNVGYLGSMFPADLLRCPKCGQVFIPEDVALTMMLEVEQLLEDK
jgi:ribosomal protein S27AE